MGCDQSTESRPASRGSAPSSEGSRGVAASDDFTPRNNPMAAPGTRRSIRHSVMSKNGKKEPAKQEASINNQIEQKMLILESASQETRSNRSSLNKQPSAAVVEYAPGADRRKSGSDTRIGTVVAHLDDIEAEIRRGKNRENVQQQDSKQQNTPIAAALASRASTASSDRTRGPSRLPHDGHGSQPPSVGGSTHPSSELEFVAIQPLSSAMGSPMSRSGNGESMSTHESASDST